MTTAPHRPTAATPAAARRSPGRLVVGLLALVLGAGALVGCDAVAAQERPSGSPTGPSTAVLEDPNVYPIAEDPQPQLPVTVRSWDGVDVTVTDVSRIVTVDLYGTLTEIVVSLGLGDNLVGRDRSASFPQVEDVPLVSAAGHDLSAEAVLNLNPTVVLTDTTVGPPEVQEQLRDAGIPVIFFDPDRTLDGVGPHITAVAEALGVPDEGRALVERVDAEIAEALSWAPAGEDPLRIAFLYVRGAAGVYLLAGPGSGADGMIEAIGAVDVGTDIGLERPFVPLTSEALVSAAPDVLLVMSGGLESMGGVDGMLSMAGIGQTPAAEDRRVVDMADTVLLSFGPRVGGSIQALAKAVHGDPTTAG